MSYDRVRDEIVAYDAIARKNLGQDIERLAASLFGARLVALRKEGTSLNGFPLPASVWIDSRTTAVSQLQSYEWLSPIEGTCFVQLGGSGSHAIKAALAGAGASWLITPMAQEASVARHLAKHLTVSDLEVVLAIGEELPLADSSVERMYGGGTLHHMDLAKGLREISRVLAPGGRAAFVDPNLNWVYKLLEVTRIRELGRERGARCYPIAEREVYENALGFKTVECRLSGGPLRYATVGLARVLKLRIPLTLAMASQSIETRLLEALRMRSALGGLAILLEK